MQVFRTAYYSALLRDGAFSWQQFGKDVYLEFPAAGNEVPIIADYEDGNTQARGVFQRVEFLLRTWRANFAQPESRMWDILAHRPTEIGKFQGKTAEKALA